MPRLPRNAEEKAHRILIEGRLTVRRVEESGLILAVCRSTSGEDYVLGYVPDEDRWGCQCKAYVDFKRECSHLKALKLVTRKPSKVREKGPAAATPRATT